jgi:hypothetical protein
MGHIAAKEIHDAVLIAAAFCMYNRYVDGLATVAPADPRAYDEMGARVAKEVTSETRERGQYLAALSNFEASPMQWVYPSRKAGKRWAQLGCAPEGPIGGYFETAAKASDKSCAFRSLFASAHPAQASARSSGVHPLFIQPAG